MADIIISTLEGTVRDGITLLTQRRFHRGPTVPPYLLRPKAPLLIEVVEFECLSKADRHGLRRANVKVRCTSWGDTNVFLELSGDGHDDWLLWGTFSIRYGADYPIPALTTKEVSKNIHPCWDKKKGDNRPMEYRLKTRVIR